MEKTELEQIATNYGKMVSYICSRMISNPIIAQEAAQETWFEIVKSIKSFKNKSKLSTWIYSITSRVVMRYSKNEKKYSTNFLHKYFRSEYPLLDFPENKEEYQLHIKQLCNNCMVGILHCLDNNSRLAYIMRDIATLSYKDISEIFKIAEPALRKDISRSRNKLRNFLNNECFLFNPEGNCKCRIKEPVKEIKLEDEFSRLRKTVHKMQLFKDAEKVLPQNNYWKNVI